MTAHVLVINSGSSSIKYQLIDVGSEQSIASGLVERIGESDSMLTHRSSGGDITREERFADHEAGLRAVLDAFESSGPSLAGTELVAVGHRVVHGGDRFADPVIVDDEVEATIEALVPLAPLHNPANLEGIRVARKVFPDLPHVAVFDTAFHQTLPPHAYTYAVPRAWARDYGVRRYGFHGTSHAYVSRAAARLLGKEPSAVNVIVLHLGNGASMSAVSGGRSVDTSMGLTPLEGLVMGTRSGDVDPSLPMHLHRTGSISLVDIDAALNRDSGLKGLAGENDMREVRRLAEVGDESARLALDVYCYRIKKYVGAYYAALGRVDAIVFTAGVGENDAYVRAHALAGLAELGIAVDDDRNQERSRSARVISPDGSRVAVLVVPTNEELEIAQEAVELVQPTAAAPPS
jgi:acetate kinase